MPYKNHIIKSPNDHRHYQHIVLDNGLAVLLVEDDQATQMAASIAVNVGHFDDPISREGMAHFLEHMLFLGTEKYPSPGEYHQFIKEYGGSSNAWTGTEHTNFFFSVEAHVIEQALDRFSQFFIAPLFNQELVDRERQAIESEFSLKLKDDIRRIYQVQKQTVNPLHPFAKFSVGNLKTLSGDPVQLRDELIQFYQTHYSANLMSLCIIAPNKLTQLQQLAIQYFSGITNKKRVKQYPDTPLYTAQQLQHQINIVPLREQKRLTVTFHLPSTSQFYKSKPLTFISHLLGYEGKGGLLSHLKNSDYATSLSAGGGINGYNFKDYNITLQLTDKGLQHTDEIIDAIFEYIELIKSQGIESWRYQERADLFKLAFKYQEPTQPIHYASHLSINMHHYKNEDLIVGDYTMLGIDKPLIKRLLGLMTPNNMLIQLVAPKQTSDQIATWYHTPFKRELISHHRLQRWQNVTPAPELALPPANPFIIADSIPRADRSQTAVPVVVSEESGYRLWHRKDDEFNVPKGHLYLSLDSPNAASSPRAAALTRLYVEMLLEFLVEETYQAEVAGLNYNIYPHQGGITLHLTGFSGKQETFLTLVINKAIECRFTQKTFDSIKQQILQTWYNQSQAKPISQLFTSLTVTLQQRSYEPSKMAQELENITLEDLHNHVRDFYQKIHLEGLIYGDWLVSEVKTLGKRLAHILSLVSTPSKESKRELVDLTGCGTLTREITTTHQDSSIIVYYQANESTSYLMALYSLLNHTMSSSFFHQLRTQKQLGYMVGTGYLPLNRYPGMIFYVQSPTTGPKQLLEAIDEFITDFNYALMQLSQKQWQNTKQGLSSQVMEHDTNLTTRGQRYWSSIGSKDYQFNQRERVVDEIDKLTRADLIKFMMQNMRTKHTDRLVLFTTGDGHHHLEPLDTSNRIDDLSYFKANSEKLNY